MLSESQREIVGEFGGSMQFLQKSVADPQLFTKELEDLLSSKYEHSVSKKTIPCQEECIDLHLAALCFETTATT